MAINNFWKDRRVLVTGGSGFVGYWLASTLSKAGAKVTVLDIKNLPKFKVLDTDYKSKISFVKGSVANEKIVSGILKKAKIQTVFHLGAEAIVTRALANPLRTMESNIKGTWVVLESARKAGVKEIVVASSDKAYGVHKKLPYKEDFALQGRFPYECSKSCTDLISLMYAKTYDMPIAVARCGNIYGGGDTNKSRIIPDAIHCLEMGKEFKIRSNGKFVRDFVYITDVVNSYIALAENMYKKGVMGQGFNFANNKPLSVLGVLGELSKAAHKKLRIKVLNQIKYEIPDQYLDSTKARKLLGWRPRVSHKEGFKDTLSWYSDFFRAGGKLID